MVENSSHNDNDANNQEGTGRRKTRLFGGRRAGKKTDAPVTSYRDAPTTPEPQPAAPAEPEVPVEVLQAQAEAPADVAPAEPAPEAPAPEAAAPEAPAAEQAPDAPVPDAPAPDAPVLDAEPHDDEPGLAPFSAAGSAFQAPERPRALSTTSLIFQAPDLPDLPPLPPRDRDPRDRDRDPRDRDPRDRDEQAAESSVRRRSRRRSGEDTRGGQDDPENTVVKVRTPREREERQPELITEPQRIKGSTRLEAKKQRRRDGRDAGRRRPVVTEAEFLARREAVDRQMVVRAKNDKIQIAVLEDGVLVEHYVAKAQDASLIGNVYLGKVQNVLPSMEAAFVDIGRGRNAVLYSGEVDWDAAAENNEGKGSQPRRIELALKSGDTVLVQVTKDPVGHKGARLTSQVSLPGRYLVYVPNGSMNGISRKLPDTERARLKRILKEVLPENVGVIVRTASEGATEEQLTLDVNRLTAQWAHISEQVQKQQAPHLLHSEPDLLIKIVRDVFNEDFHKLVISGDDAQATIENYLAAVAPDLLDRVEKYEGEKDAFDEYRVSEQIEKALDRKVWLPSGGSLVIDRTEAMTVVDVNTGKFVGSGGNLEETVTKNNLEAAEEIVRQLRLRDIGGIIVVDFIDMVLESNRDLVLRRLIECLSRDRTKHQVAEVTSLGLVQMTRKKLGLGLLESFSEPCEQCAGRGIIVHHDPVVKHRSSQQSSAGSNGGSGNGGSNGSNGAGRRNGRGGSNGNGSNGNGNGSGSNGNGSTGSGSQTAPVGGTHAITENAKNALAQIAASTIAAAKHADGQAPDAGPAPVTEPAAAPSDAPAAAAEAPAAEPARRPDAAVAAERSTRRRKSRHSRGDAEQTPAAEAAEAEAATEVPAAQSPAEAPATEAAHEASEPAQPVSAPSFDEVSAPVVLDAPTEPAAPEQAPVAEPAAAEPLAAEPAVAEPAADDEPAIAILDIPVTKAARAPRVKPEEASHLLDSVLDALPAPKQPGQGRSRSRRVSTTAVVSAPAESSDS
ncbi:Rne/Rng family ribonuclease [Herbiconiux sp. VKM Ac-1786]|uniref:Rne/Rng family ribonuclease n=1 Tax=Herbiconiux sp. VKM Ac-1786 TaxID=2783824 RepID=UPI00188C3AFF|nr:Rne/Rng family ribonuclease [Herbiconiux sp. VKM Ac-1786]MBF4573342.1 Rne/Rng family ribonuclease [Herbiconiux sp. VKM Ac-1786]